MAGEVVNSSFVLLSKFVTSRQESTSKITASHLHKPLPICKETDKAFILFANVQSNEAEKGLMILLDELKIKYGANSLLFSPGYQ